GTERLEARHLDHDQRHQRQRRRHRDVPRGRGAPRHQPQQVAEQNEEEERQNERNELLPAVADVRQRDLVPQEHDERFHHVRQAARRALHPFAPLHPPRRPDHRDRDQRGRQQHEHHVLRGRQIHRQRTDVDRVPLGQRERPERSLHHPRIHHVVHDHVTERGLLTRLGRARPGKDSSDHSARSPLRKKTGSSSSSRNRKPARLNSTASGGYPLRASQSPTQTTSPHLTTVPPPHATKNAGRLRSATSAAKLAT